MIYNSAGYRPRSARHPAGGGWGILLPPTLRFLPASCLALLACDARLWLAVSRWETFVHSEAMTKRKLKLGRLTIIGDAGVDRGGNKLVRCRCRCKKVIVTRLERLRRGVCKSCGCLLRDKAPGWGRKFGGLANLIHGQHKSKTYASYMAMVQRCTNPNHEHYRLYKDVKITPRWLGPKGFIHFLADKHERPKSKTLGRILDVKLYSKRTCAWQTIWEQRAHQRRRRAKHKLRAA
jgi:hypothetical protein